MVLLIMLFTYSLLSVAGFSFTDKNHPDVNPSEIFEMVQKRAGHNNGAEEITVSDTRQVIIAKALEYLEKSHDPEMYRFAVSPRWIPGSLLNIRPEQIKQVVPDGSVERYTNFEVTYEQENRRYTSQIQLMVDTERKLPVANRRIISGEKIAPGDLDMRWISVLHDRGQLVESIDTIEGKVLRRSLSNGQPVRHVDVSTEYLVEAGDTVRLIMEEYGIRIEITAEARQSGAQDEEIRIYNSETRKRYLGKIISPGEVKWLRTL